MDLTGLRKKWLRPESGSGFQVLHPKYTGFEQALKDLEGQRRENGVHRHEGIRGRVLRS